jgi:hypothetical protein
MQRSNLLLLHSEIENLQLLAVVVGFRVDVSRFNVIGAITMYKKQT